jgi:ABC-type lipoprotein export system ATPase subunit
LPDYTIEKNIRIANELQGKETTTEEVDEVLKLVDLAGLNNRMPSQLSGGQKQRVAIARALIKNPRIIMADEPTGALDQATGIQVMEALKKLSKEKLVVVVSHDMEMAERYADRIVRLVDGKLAEDVTLSEEETVKKVSVKFGSFVRQETVVVVKPAATAVLNIPLTTTLPF